MRAENPVFRRHWKRKDGTMYESPVWWIRYSHRGHEIKESAKTTSEKAAWKLLEQRQKERQRPTFIGPKEEKLTLDDLESKILADYKKHNRRSAATVKHCLKRVKAFFAFDRLVDIGTERIDQYQEARLSEGAARATVNREMAYLRHGYKLLIKGRQISRAPEIKLLEDENVRQGFLSKADFDKLVGNLEPQARDIVIFLYNSGWRSKEAMTLEWKDVDGSLYKLWIRADRGKERSSTICGLGPTRYAPIRCEELPQGRTL
jgi:integrase